MESIRKSIQSLSISILLLAASGVTIVVASWISEYQLKKRIEALEQRINNVTP